MSECMLWNLSNLSKKETPFPIYCAYLRAFCFCTQCCNLCWKPAAVWNKRMKYLYVYTWGQRRLVQRRQQRLGGGRLEAAEHSFICRCNFPFRKKKKKEFPRQPWRSGLWRLGHGSVQSTPGVGEGKRCARLHTVCRLNYKSLLRNTPLASATRPWMSGWRRTDGWTDGCMGGWLHRADWPCYKLRFSSI